MTLASRPSACLAGLVLVALAGGCTVVGTTVPPAEYSELGDSRNYRVTARATRYEAGRIRVEDSTLVILGPNDPLHDPHRYPVVVPLSEVQSIETLRMENLVYVEAGVQFPSAQGGVAAPAADDLIAELEFGHITGQRLGVRPSRWGFGGTIGVLVGNETESHAALKARVRYRFHRHFSTDLFAGPMMHSWGDGPWDGFTVGVGLNLGPYFSLKSEFVSVEQPSWRTFNSDGHTTEVFPAGHAKTWYNGVALRGGPAWITLGAGSAALILLTVVVIVSLQGASFGS